MPTDDPNELLSLKHEQDEHKAQFTNFARNVSGETPQETDKEFLLQRRVLDEQNRMKSVENKQE